MVNQSTCMAFSAIAAVAACVFLGTVVAQPQQSISLYTTTSTVVSAVGTAGVVSRPTNMQPHKSQTATAALPFGEVDAVPSNPLARGTGASVLRLAQVSSGVVLAVGAALYAVARLFKGPERQSLSPVDLAHHYGSRTMAMATATATKDGPMIEKAPGVLFNRVAREWRCKWTDNAALSAAQQVLEKHLPALKGMAGAEVQRVVCGGCKDFKVVTSVPAADFGAFEASGHGPEAAFLEELKGIDGISQVETQTYTFQDLDVAPVEDGPMKTVCDGVQFNRIAREWRCKWSDDNDSRSLVEAQKVIEELLPQLRGMPGSQVQRVVCGGCKDLKVMTSIPAENFDAWAAVRFKPEENFLNEVTSIRGISQVEVQTFTLMSRTGDIPPGSAEYSEKAKGVFFNRVAREWRCKWSAENDKASLVAAQKVLEKYEATLKGMEGVQVQRVVCGGGLDFKVITSVPADRFGAWKDAEFPPEAEFLAELSAIEGISQVETQMYTLQHLDGTVLTEGAMKEKAPGVMFNRVAREWRCKWEDDAALTACQKVLDEHLYSLKGRTGSRVQRVVCGGCKDFKVVTSVPASDFGMWEDEDFTPESAFLKQLKAIPGVSQVETQMYTFQTL
uniref:Uncharacterized protein n=1 Tax=Eutreptiella gymnastica TaxID=73025 RepID=A0A7S1I8C1_9EUGL